MQPQRLGTGPRVAVVIPCFNQGVYLPGAVASALDQTYPHVEIVVVVDGSTDDSLRTAQALAAAAPGRVRLIARENGGLPVARNTAISRLDTDYVCCLDADDELTPTYLERCIAVLEADPGLSIAYGGQQNFEEDDAFHPHHAFDFRFHTISNLLGVASVYRRQAWADVAGYSSMDSYEDWDFWIGCCERGHVPVHVPEAVFRYRVRTGSMYDEATRRDARLKARIVSNHPVLYTHRQREWADRVLAGDLAAVALPAPLGRIPLFREDPPPPAGFEPLPPVAGPELGEVRRLLVGVRLDDLAADPPLLAEYCAAVSPDDDATLVVIAETTAADAAAARFAAAARAAAVADECVPDAVLACGLVPGAELRALSFRLDALLAARRPSQDLGVPPRVADATAIRGLLRTELAA